MYSFHLLHITKFKTNLFDFILILVFLAGSSRSNSTASISDSLLIDFSSSSTSWAPAQDFLESSPNSSHFRVFDEKFGESMNDMITDEYF